MDVDFWQQRWRDGRIGFHRDDVNPWLREGLPALSLAPGARVLVPLCGKSLDLGWLAEQGLRPVGVELSAIACEALFEERGVTPTRAPLGPLERWSADGIEVLCGDFFSPAVMQSGPFDAFWDRAALIALPASMRSDYVAQCGRLLRPGARGLLVSIAYDPDVMDGPPFPVTPDEVRALYTPRFELTPSVEGQYCEPAEHLRERGLNELHESVWQLRRRVGGEREQ